MKYKEIEICLVLPYFLSTQTPSKHKKNILKIRYTQQTNNSELSKKENIPKIKREVEKQRRPRHREGEQQRLK